MPMRIWIRLSLVFTVEAREAIQEHLAALFAPESGKPENVEASTRVERLAEHLPVDTSSSSPLALPTVISEAEREELAADNAVRHDWIAEGGKQEREAHGTYFSLNQSQLPQQIVAEFMQRWSREATYEESRAHVGMETQRPWSDPAIERTTPLLFGLSSLVALFAHALSPA